MGAKRPLSIGRIGGGVDTDVAYLHDVPFSSSRVRLLTVAVLAIGALADCLCGKPCDEQHFAAHCEGNVAVYCGHDRLTPSHLVRQDCDDAYPERGTCEEETGSEGVRFASCVVHCDPVRPERCVSLPSANWQSIRCGPPRTDGGAPVLEVENCIAGPCRVLATDSGARATCGILVDGGFVALPR
jgi:hypothetical protein